MRLLKEFEKRDKSLIAKLELKREEKADVVAKMAECQDKLAARKVGCVYVCMYMCMCMCICICIDVVIKMAECQDNLAARKVGCVYGCV